VGRCLKLLSSRRCAQLCRVDAAGGRDFLAALLRLHLARYAAAADEAAPFDPPHPDDDTLRLPAMGEFGVLEAIRQRWPQFLLCAVPVLLPYLVLPVAAVANLLWPLPVLAITAVSVYLAAAWTLLNFALFTVGAYHSPVLLELGRRPLHQAIPGARPALTAWRYNWAGRRHPYCCLLWQRGDIGVRVHEGLGPRYVVLRQGWRRLQLGTGLPDRHLDHLAHIIEGRILRT